MRFGNLLLTSVGIHLLPISFTPVLVSPLILIKNFVTVACGEEEAWEPLRVDDVDE